MIPSVNFARPVAGCGERAQRVLPVFRSAGGRAFATAVRRKQNIQAGPARFNRS
ncbi:MAG: hypothetical protein GMKNLPBB_01113 [Myxococcota bacterium]|nr:hypothetical protein [Myxococcota bacterium]